MNDVIIEAPRGAMYLTDNNWMTSIPENCVFNKGITGCGATTLAIKQPGHTILAMPFRGLVDNKANSNPEVLGIHGDMDRESAIINYLRTHEQIKIATTYDSFPFVCDVLITQGFNPYKDMFLFVDEWHILFNSYNLRKRSAKKLLERAKLFERKTFVSATPVPREFWLTELQGLPEYKIEWPDATQINVSSKRVKDPLAYMTRLCKSRMKHGGEENYHIFLNSVEGISKIIRLAGLYPEECLVVCSVGKDSKDTNLAKLPEGFRIGNTSEKPKLFNFYTSTCFEGQDILDPVGRTFIVSEKYKDHTKMDVMTTLLQICGRIRDSRYKFEIIQIYSDSIYKDVTLDEFKQSILRTVEEAERNAALLDQVSGSSRERLLKEFVNKEPYMDVQDGRIIVDRNLANLQIVNYGIVNGQYKTQCNMNAALRSAGVQVSNDLGKYEIDDEELEDVQSIERTPFKQIFEEYVDLCKEPYNMNYFRKNRIEIEKPLVKEAYEKLGPDKVREMKYHQSNVKRELTKLQHETLDTKIFLLLDEQLPRQVAIPRSEIKEKLQMIYDELGTKQTAKATDIKRWYNVKETSRRTTTGTEACLAIISARISAREACRIK